MIELDRPLKARLREPPRPDVDAIWERIRARRTGARRFAVHRSQWRWALVPALCLAGAWLAHRAYLARQPSALRLRDGGAIEVVNTGAEARTLALSDGSRLEIGPGAQLAPRKLDEHLFASELVRGRVTFAVLPPGPRRWTIDAGDVQVSVLGTRFDVERSAQGVRVSVERGLVEVTGPGVPNGTRRLGAGQRLAVQPTAARAPAETAAPARPLATPQPVQAAPLVARSGADPQFDSADSALPAAASGRLGQRGRVGPASPSAASSGPATTGSGTPTRSRRPTASARAGGSTATGATASERARAEADVDVEVLLADADTARATGQPRQAARALQQIVDRYESDARTALAAFTLGQLYLDQLARPDLAARAFVRAHTLGLPRALEEEGAVRLVESYFRSGQAARAREAALDYLVRYPNGARLRQVEAWAGLQ